jgi:hypothetical protein
VNPTNVYWTGYVANAVFSVPVGGGVITTVASNQISPTYIAADATDVYWADWGAGSMGGPVMQASLDGVVTTLASGQLYVQGIAVGPTGVYWTDENVYNNPSFPGGVDTVPLGGGPVTMVAGLAPTFPEAPASIAIDSTSIYWVMEGAAVWKAPLGGGALTMFSAEGVSMLAVNSSGIYMYQAAGIVMLPLDGGQATTVAAGVTSVGALAVDETNVYWTSGTSVLAIPLAGGAITTLATGQFSPGNLAVDATSVYWTTDNGTGGTVMQLTPK